MEYKHSFIMDAEDNGVSVCTDLGDRVIGSHSFGGILWLDCLEVLEETELVRVHCCCIINHYEPQETGTQEGSLLGMLTSVLSKTHVRGMETRVTSKCFWIHWQVLKFLFMDMIIIFSWNFQKMIVFEESRGLSWKSILVYQHDLIFRVLFFKYV